MFTRKAKSSTISAAALRVSGGSRCGNERGAANTDTEKQSRSSCLSGGAAAYLANRLAKSVSVSSMSPHHQMDRSYFDSEKGDEMVFTNEELWILIRTMIEELYFENDIADEMACRTSDTRITEHQEERITRRAEILKKLEREAVLRGLIVPEPEE